MISIAWRTRPRRLRPLCSLLTLTLTLALTACTSLAPPAAPQARAYREAIDLGGRLSVHYQKNGKEEALHGSFTWVQSARHASVTMLSPLGQTLATIEVTPASSTLTQAGQIPRVADDVDALAAEALGWPLPVAGLRDWLQGFAIDAEGRRITALPGEAATLTTRDGWRIRFDSWHSDGPTPGPSHPGRIDLERRTAQAGQVSIRIVIDYRQAP